MILTSQTIVKYSSEYYRLFDELCFKAKNLYNASLYKLRQAHFEYDAIMSYGSIDKVLKREQSIDYADMPMASSAQGTLKLVIANWNSFWAALKSYSRNPEKFLGKPKMPQYLHKTNGRSAIFLANQNVKVKAGVLHFPKSFNGFTVPVNFDSSNIQQVRIIPKNKHFAVEIVYKIQDIPLNEGSVLQLLKSPKNVREKPKINDD